MIVMTVMRHCHCHASLPCITAMHHCTPLHILAHFRTFALHSSSEYYLLLLFVIIIILWCVAYVGGACDDECVMSGDGGGGGGGGGGVPCHAP